MILFSRFTQYLLVDKLKSIKVRIIFEKKIEKSTCTIMIRIIVIVAPKSNIAVITLILGSRNMTKLSKNMSL